MPLDASLGVSFVQLELLACVGLPPARGLSELAAGMGLSLSAAQLREAQRLGDGLPLQQGLWMLEGLAHLEGGRARLLGLSWALGTMMGGDAFSRVKVAKTLSGVRAWMGSYLAFADPQAVGAQAVGALVAGEPDSALLGMVGQRGLDLALQMLPGLRKLAAESLGSAGLDAHGPRLAFSAIAPHIVAELALRQALDGQRYLALSTGPKAAKVGPFGMPVGPPVRSQDGLFGAAVPEPKPSSAPARKPSPAAPMPLAAKPAPLEFTPAPGSAAPAFAAAPVPPLEHVFGPDKPEADPSAPPALAGAPKGPAPKRSASGGGQWMAALIFALVLGLVVLLGATVVMGWVSL